MIVKTMIQKKKVKKTAFNGNSNIKITVGIFIVSGRKESTK